MKLNIILSLILLLSASLFVDASPLYKRSECPSIIGDTEQPEGLPSDLTPSKGSFKFPLYASGVQIYKCEASNKTWTLVGPKAELYSIVDGKPKDLIGRHYSRETAINGGKATWESTLDCDNSYVVGLSKATHAVEPENIPWLLLKATYNYGEGAFGDVSYVVRINTKDGVAPPADKCGSKYADQELYESHYTTDYWFFN